MTKTKRQLRADGVTHAHDRYTASDDAAIREMYPLGNTAEIAESLGRTECAIWARARLLGVRKAPPSARSGYYFECRQCGEGVTVTDPDDRRSVFCSRKCARRYWRHRARDERRAQNEVGHATNEWLDKLAVERV